MKKFAILLIAGLLTACGSPAAQSFGNSVALHPTVRYASGPSPVKHIIIVMQENRSFDNLFHGFPGADTAVSGPGKGGKTYTLQQVPLKWTWDLRHDHLQFLEDYDHGKADGFNSQIRSPKGGSGCSDWRNHPKCWNIYKGKQIEQMAYAYVDPSQIKPYWTMAQEYALGDKAFASNNGPSFPSHQYMIAGQSGHAAEVPDGQPWGCDADPSVTVTLLKYGSAHPPVFSKAVGHEVDGPRPCFTYATIADLLDAAKVKWRFYASQPKNSGGNLLAFDAIQAIRYGPDWQSSIERPDTLILKDIAAGNLQPVSWVTPSGSKSDHAGRDSGAGGPDWVASIVNAVGTSPYWNDTAIVVMWDEWGGWYDHVVPPQLPDVTTKAYEGLGFRVPLIVISPYARAGYVSHQQHEIAGTLRLIENTFGLPSLGGADARTDGFDDMFDFTQTPIPFQPIPTKLKAKDFLNSTDDTPGDTE